MSTTTATPASDTTSTVPQQVDHHHQLLVQGPEAASMVIDPSRPKSKQRDLTEVEARLLTTEIKRTSVRLWILVTEAHNRKAHAALGYKTWDDYARAELQMSPSRSYQLLDTGRVMHELAASGVDIETLEPPPARIIARIKDHLPEVRKAGRQAIRDNQPVSAALKELAKVPQATASVATAPASRAAASSSSSSGSTGSGTGRGPVKCPACEGEGKVPRGFAASLRAWIKTR